MRGYVSFYGACGNRCVAGAETLILSRFAGFVGENNSAIPLLFGKTIIIDKYYCGFPIYVHYYNLGRKWKNI